MATQTLRPNAEVDATNWSRTGGTTKWGVLADDSDATIIRADFGGATAQFDLTSYTLLAGERVKQYRVRARLKDSGGTGAAYRFRATSGTSSGAASSGTATGTTSVTGPWLTDLIDTSADQQSWVDDLQWRVDDLSSNVPGDLSAVEAFLDLDVWERTDAPTVTTDPAGAGGPPPVITTTDSPAVQLSTAVNDGDPSTWSWQTRMFRDAVYLAGGFDAETETDVEWEDLATGQTSSPATTRTVAGQMLANGDTYRAYVRVGKEGVAGQTLWSTWGFYEFELDLTLPTSPTLAVQVDQPQGRQVVTVTPATLTHDTLDQIDIERSDDGGATWAMIRSGTLASGISAGTPVAVSDWDAPRGVPLIYRARVTEGLTASDTQISSAWAVAAAVAHPLSGWWIYDVPTFADVCSGALLIQQPTLTAVEQVGVFRPIGRTTAVVVTGQDALPEDATLRIHTFGQDEYDQIGRLLTLPQALLFKSPFGWQRYWRVISRQRIDRSVVGRVEATWTVQVVEVDGGI